MALEPESLRGLVNQSSPALMVYKLRDQRHRIAQLAGLQGAIWFRAQHRRTADRVRRRGLDLYHADALRGFARRTRYHRISVSRMRPRTIGAPVCRLLPLSSLMSRLPEDDLRSRTKFDLADVVLGVVAAGA